VVKHPEFLDDHLPPSCAEVKNNCRYTSAPVRGSNPGGARFFAHVQTGPEAHPASCTMGTGSFPGVKRPRRGADHPSTSSAEVKKE
jgi:hypothetical protein